MSIQEIIYNAKSLESRSEKLQHQINELEDAAATPPPEGQVLAQIPLLAEATIRGILEGEIKKWQRVCAVLAALGWGLLIVTVVMFSTLSLLH